MSARPRATFRGKSGFGSPAKLYRTKSNMAAKRKSRPTPRVRSKTPVPNVSAGMRLQKFLASAGVGSRRDCEVLIVEGRIEVDDQVVTELGTRIDPEKQVVSFDGQRVRLERHQYFMLNKPPGVLSTAADPSGRTRVVDLISSHQRVYNVGRLDKSSEGLILVTNDGTLAQYLTHPSFGVEKVYHVVVKGTPKFEDLQTLKLGVHLAEGVAKVKDVDIRKRLKDTTELRMVLDEGKNREIRRMLARIGHKVLRLIRVAIGPLMLGDLPAGAHRRLDHEEIAELKSWAERVAKGLPPKTVLKSGKKSKPRPATKKRASAQSSGLAGDPTMIAANPVQEKIVTGRPIHLDDVRKAKEWRRQQAMQGKKGGKSTGSNRGSSTDAKGTGARSTGSKLAGSRFSGAGKTTSGRTSPATAPRAAGSRPARSKSSAKPMGSRSRTGGLGSSGGRPKSPSAPKGKRGGGRRAPKR